MTMARIPHSRALTWLPLLAVLALLVASVATGRGPGVDSAVAASTINVDGEITTDIFVDATGCGATAVAIGQLVVADPWKTAQDEGSATCSIDFGTTNHAAGTSLTMLEDPAAPATPTDAMKCTSGDCTGSAMDDYEGSSEPTPGTSAFGVQLLAAGGAASSVWSTAPAVYDVQDTGDAACQTSGVGTGSCDFTFGATAGSSDQVGTYQAEAQLLVLAR